MQNTLTANHSVKSRELFGHITDQGLNKLLHNNVIYVLHLQAIPKH